MHKKRHKVLVCNISCERQTEKGRQRDRDKTTSKDIERQYKIQTNRERDIRLDGQRRNTVLVCIIACARQIKNDTDKARERHRHTETERQD